MNDLLLTLQRIQRESGFAPPDKPDEANGAGRRRDADGGVSDFNKARERVDTHIRNIRVTLKERDELLERKAGTKVTVELNANVREQMKLARRDIDALDRAAARRREQLERRAKKTGMSDDDQGEIEAMGEIVELAGKHLKECELLRARRGGANFVPDGSDSENDAPTVSALPHVNDDGALGAKFQLLHRQDAEIDQGIDRVREGVAVLRDMAAELNDAAELQNAMLLEIDDNVDRNQEQLTYANKRLKGILDKTRTPTRFLVDVVCIVILLIVAGIVLKLVLDYVPGARPS